MLTQNQTKQNCLRSLNRRQNINIKYCENAFFTFPNIEVGRKNL